MNIFLDGLILLILVLYVLRGVFKGFISSVINFAGMIVSASLSSYLGKLLSLSVYNSFFKESIENAVADTINNSVGAGISDVMDKIVSAVPGLKIIAPWINDSQELSNALSGGSASAASAVEDIVAPIVTGFLTVILTACIFALLMIVVRLISRLVSRKVQTPVLNTFNRALGGFIGFLSGIVFIMLITELVKIFSQFVGGAPLIGEETINSTILFCLFYNYNLFDYIFSPLLHSVYAGASYVTANMGG